MVIWEQIPVLARLIIAAHSLFYQLHEYASMLKLIRGLYMYNHLVTSMQTETYPHLFMMRIKIKYLPNMVILHLHGYTPHLKRYACAVMH